MHQKFGKTWGRYAGVNPTIVTIDPEIIKEVMIKQVRVSSLFLLNFLNIS
jgi:hypothetical protein